MARFFVSIENEISTIGAIVKHFLLVFIAILFGQTGDAQAIDRVTDKLMSKFDQLIQGEFDNYNQINFQNNEFLDKADVPSIKHARLYKRVTRINAPQLGAFVYYHQIHEGGKDKPIYRQSIQVVSPDYQNNKLIAENFTFLTPEKYTDLWREEKEVDLNLNNLKPVGEQCQSQYRLVGNSFVGGIDKQKCKVKSKKFGYLNLSTEQVYSREAFWHLEEGFLPSGKELFGRSDDIPHKLRRVKNFKCWAAFKTEKLKANGDAYWDFNSNINIHNQGDIAEFTTTDKIPKHYFIRLKETIFPAGKRPDVFEMFIHENTQESKTNYTQALSYTWTNTEATRLGINLRWMQASCSLKN